MKKEQFFRLLGELDDRFLEKYRQIDMHLSRKAMRKKRTLRILVAAACLALLIGACVPVGMMVAKWMDEGYAGPGPDPGGESGVEHGTGEPPQQDSSVTIRSFEELEEMREMLECKDEQMLDAYLQKVLSGRIKSKQELANFVTLVDNMAYAWLIDGELTWLCYQKGPSAGTGEIYEVLYVTVTAPNGDWVRCNYQLSWTDVEKTINKLVQNSANENLLPAPLSTADGRLTLYVETRGPHPTYDGDFIEWWCVLDGQIVEIDYFVADADKIDTAALIGSLEVADSITDYLENVTEPVTTQPPRETESQWNPDEIPDFVKLGYLNIAVLDANGDVAYRVDAETLQSMNRSVEVEYVPGGTLILECYAAYDRSGTVVNYRCSAEGGAAEQISFSEIETELTVDVQAEYVHYLRFSVPMDNMVTDNGKGYFMTMLGDAFAEIDGWALFEYITVYLVDAGGFGLFDLEKTHCPSYEDYLEVQACIDAGQPPMTDVVEILGKPHGYDSAAGMRIFVWTAEDGGTITVHVLSPDAEPMQWDEILTAEYGGAVAHHAYYYKGE
ncbi:MAG: hypothetical protein IJW70_05665 [Clostridia bacterium]|nr:hypothetical protein [Clostridia bacterium]